MHRRIIEIHGKYIGKQRRNIGNLLGNYRDPVCVLGYIGTIINTIIGNSERFQPKQFEGNLDMLRI